MDDTEWSDLAEAAHRALVELRKHVGGHDLHMKVVEAAIIATSELAEELNLEDDQE